MSEIELAHAEGDMDVSRGLSEYIEVEAEWVSSVHAAPRVPSAGDLSRQRSSGMQEGTYLADDPLTLYRADQPLTGEEVELLEALRAGPGGKRFLDALVEAKVSFADGTDGALFLRCAKNQPGPCEQVVRQLLPLAMDFYGQGRYAAASGCSALSLRLCLATLGFEHPGTLASVDNLGVCLESLGLASKALPLHERALEIRERVLGAEHPGTLNNVNNLAECLRSLGFATKALPLYERALEARERLLGADHPNTLTSVNSLAECLRSLGFATKALPLHERALEARERLLGPDHMNTLTSVNNLAACFQSLGLAPKALPLCERALEGLERMLGAEHPNTLTSVNNLAACFELLGLASKALPLHERALEIRERVLGAEHPDTLISINNLAECLRSLGFASNALPLLERAFDARERLLGAEHPDTLTSADNLAACFDSLGFVARALPLRKRALEARERLLGADHQGTLISVNSLAQCLELLGFAAKALPLFERALEARERLLGPVHMNTLTSVNNLAACFQSLGLAPKALPLFERAFEDFERTLGAEHTNTLASINNLAACLSALGLAVKALPLYERALEGFEHTLGAEHANTLASINNLAACLSALGFAAKALPLHNRALAVRERVLGADHPETLYGVSNLAKCLLELDLGSIALPVCERAFEGFERVFGTEHPDTLTSIHNLAACLSALGLASKARPLYERALEAGERVHGLEHPGTLISVYCLALCLDSLGLTSKALPLHERALEARERVLGPEHPDTLISVNCLALCLDSLGNFEAAVVRWRELAAHLPLRPVAGGTWMQLLKNTATAIRSHAKAGRMADWDLQLASLSTALRQVIDLESSEQLEVSRATALRFFGIHLGLCIDQGRSDLVPQVLAARQGRKLAALVLDEIEAQGDALATDSLAGRFQAVRVELRRLALGLRTGDDAPGASMAQPTDRAHLSADALNERQRAQSRAYTAKLKEYRALREELARSDPDFAIPARALEVSMAQLQSRLGPREALLLLFERDDPRARLALLITRSASVLVPLVDEALVQAGVLSAHWSRALHSRSGMRRGVMPQSELTAAPHDHAGAGLPVSPLDRLGALLREGLWALLASHLDGVQRLHVVTHGSFHLLPLECGAPAGLALCTYPGFIYYHRLRHQEAAASELIAAGGLLGMAVHDAESEPDLPPIPFVKAEAQIVRSLWPGTVRLDPDLAQAVPPLAVLQLAGHGQTDPKDPARAGLLMSGGALDLHAVLGMKQRPAVVVLSACTVGRTADDPDGEPLGLVGGFMLKGARIVIASLQPVPDFYIPLLMALFYRGWREVASPAEALTDAKRRLALGQWHADTEALIRQSYRSVLIDTLADAQRQRSDSGQIDPLLSLTHAWLFPARYRALHPPRGTEQMAELRMLVGTPAGQEQMADAVLQTLVDERERLPRQHVETLCTWVVAFGMRW